MFSSKLVCLQDDMGSEVSDDVSSETYKELFELFTNSGDWVINIQVSSGEQTIFSCIILQIIDSERVLNDCDNSLEQRKWYNYPMLVAIIYEPFSVKKAYNSNSC